MDLEEDDVGDSDGSIVLREPEDGSNVSDGQDVNVKRCPSGATATDSEMAFKIKADIAIVMENRI